MQIPEAMEAILRAADIDQPIHSHKLNTDLTKARIALGEAIEPGLHAGAAAEIVAWSLSTEAWGLEPWRCFFGPYGSYTDDAGNVGYSPAVHSLPAGLHDHWISRVEAFGHPVMRARYADLSWELAKPVGNTRPNFRHAQMAVDGYLASLVGNALDDFHDRIVAASRALQLSRQIGDAQRAELATVSLLDIHAVAVSGEGWWWKTYDRLVGDRKLTADRRSDLAKSLETMVLEKGNSSEAGSFDPFELENVAQRLRAYYSRVGSRSDVVRLHEIEGRAFEHSAGMGDAMRASSLLQNAENAFQDAGLEEDAKRVRNARIDAIRKSRDEMKSFSFTQTITREEMDAFLSTVIVDSPLHTLARIASEFVAHVPSIETQVRKAAEGSLLGLIPIGLMAKDHQAAAIGGLDDDLDGHLLHHAQRNIQFSSAYLNRALRVAVERHDFNPYSFAGFAERTGLFDDGTFILEGIAAWFAGDDTKAIFVLTPQIEYALRAIAGKLGEPVTKKHNTMSDREVAIGMGDILGNSVVRATLGNDLCFHFRLVYSDPRGLNLRNSVAHGLLERGMVNSVVSDLLIHTLLVLGVWDQLSAYRSGLSPGQ